MPAPRSKRRRSATTRGMPCLAATATTTTTLSSVDIQNGGLLWLVVVLLLSSSTTSSFKCAAAAFTQPQDSKRPQQVPRLSRRRTKDNNNNMTPFFAVERMLPPLSPIRMRRPTLPSQYSTSPGGGPANGTSTLTIPYSSSARDEEMLEYDPPSGGVDPQALPVLYTNCPKQLNRWLVEHVPMEACAIGFDTEVGFCFRSCFVL